MVMKRGSDAEDEDNGVDISVKPIRQTSKGKIRVKKKKSSSAGGGILKKPALHVVGPILVLVGLSLSLLGFIQSIRSLPDINPDGKTKWFPGGEGLHDRLDKIRDALMKEDPTESSKGDSKEAPKLVRREKQISSNHIKLPASTWPVSIRDEEDNFEEIVHPGDGTTRIPVPKFWSPPLNDGKLMSPELAARIGTYTHGGTDKDPKHRGPVDERTIFVAIASYRDFQCRYTVESILGTAKYPERVRVAVVDQIIEGDDSCGVPIKSCETYPEQAMCKYKDNIDVVELDGLLAVGPVFARHMGHRLYRGEYYAMQIDAHVTFVKDWDVDIISQIESTNNEMATLSTYLTDIEGSIDETTGRSLRNTRPIMCNTDYEGGIQGKHLRHMQQPESEPPIKGTPQLQPYWAAGFSFSRGHFVVNVPYDLYLPMIFQGEEISVGVRAFTYGYDHYAPERSICFHTYAKGSNLEVRNKVKHFWEHARLYEGTGIRAMKRLIGIIGGNPEVHRSEWIHDEEKLYGLGKVRETSKFYETFGIDVVHKVVEQHLCVFVHSGRMHHTFLENLRPDSMGIDYSKIDFKFKNPEK